MAFAQFDFFSVSLKRPVSINVVLPTDKFMFDGSKPDPDRKFPTLYLLHGVFGDFTDWVHGSRVQRLAQDHGICVVMPSGDNKFYCNSSKSGDLYGDFIGQELVDFTRRTLPLIRDRDHTFIGGLSMGGFGSLVNGFRNPETFSRITPLSAALIKNKILSSVDEPGHDIFTKTQYETLFDLADVNDFEGSVNDYEALAKELAASGKQLPEIYMACGQQDGLFEKNTAFRDLLLDLGYKVTWHEAPGVHNWDYWDMEIENVLNYLPLEENEKGISSENVGQ